MLSFFRTYLGLINEEAQVILRVQSYHISVEYLGIVMMVWVDTLCLGIWTLRVITLRDRHA